MPSLVMLGLAGIVVILGVYVAIGNKKDLISRLTVVIGIVLIALIVLNFSSFNHEVFNWFYQHSFFRALFEAK